VLGRPSNGEAWPIAVPTRAGTQTVTLEHGALATSGAARRRWSQGAHERHPLPDPRTGEPARSGLWSVSVGAATYAGSVLLVGALLLTRLLTPISPRGRTHPRLVAVVLVGGIAWAATGPAHAGWTAMASHVARRQGDDYGTPRGGRTGWTARCELPPHTASAELDAPWSTVRHQSLQRARGKRLVATMTRIS
jgi:hypothetical protein